MRNRKSPHFGQSGTRFRSYYGTRRSVATLVVCYLPNVSPSTPARVASALPECELNLDRLALSLGDHVERLLPVIQFERVGDEGLDIHKGV